MLPILPSPLVDEYRNKVQFPVQPGPDGKPQIGFYAPRSHRLVPCGSCRLQPALLNEIAAEICKNPLDAAETLKNVGLAQRMDNFPAQLSGGEQQRVSIARAIAKNPKLLLCDEPTGALDYETGKAILKLLQDVCRESGKTVIVITHNQAITQMADRVIRVKNGKVWSEEVQENPADVSVIEW